jgi:hypothetical protein
MGAVLISRNDLSALDPEAAARVTQALARVISGSPGAYRVSIERALGETDVIIRIEEHRPGMPPWKRELRMDPALLATRAEERLAALVRGAD